MTSPVPVLLAASTAGRLARLRDAWMPRLAAAGLRAGAVWSPADAAQEHRAAADSLAGDLGIPHVGPEAPDAGLGAVVAVVHGPSRDEILRVARGAPVLLAEPVLDDPERLAAALDAAPGLPLVLGSPLAAAPGVETVLGAVREARIGLLRAVTLDVVLGAGTGPAGGDDLSGAGAELVGLVRALTGPARLRLSAAAGPAAWSVLGQTDRDVVVSLQLSRLVHGDAEPLLARLRVIGTHGDVVADLLAPGLEVTRADGRTRVPYGAGAEARILARLSDVVAGRREPDRHADVLTLARAVDAVADAAASAEARDVAW